MRGKRWTNVFVVNLRIVLGFAFVPAGLKKVLGQPFTDPQNTGAFHELLHAFHDTGAFYQLVGLTQLVIAVLLMTQRFATLGALMALPVFAAIAAFCWSTQVLFTAVMVTLMLLASVALAVWDLEKWRGIFRADGTAPEPPLEAPDQPIDMRLWERCGLLVLAVYLGSCAYAGGIYRPRHLELDNPAFYVFPFIALLPIATLAREQWRRKHTNMPGA